jgi:hypothetical protein
MKRILPLLFVSPFAVQAVNSDFSLIRSIDSSPGAVVYGIAVDDQDGSVYLV